MKTQTQKVNDLAVAIMNFENETNVGGLIRTANAAALTEVVIVGKKNWNKGASTGAYSSMQVTRVRSSDEFLEYCQKKDYQIVSVEIGEESVSLFEFKYPKNTILVLGNEGTGVPEKILRESVGKVYIPQYGAMECLNVSVAGAIAIYDWVRKNNCLPENGVVDHKFKQK